jgi:hypothetical protein
MFQRALQVFFFLWTGCLLMGAVVPSFDFWTTFDNLFSPFYVDAPSWIFHTLSDYSETVNQMDTSNYHPMQEFFWLVWWLATVALSLALPVLWWVVVTFTFWLSLYAVNQPLSLIILPGDNSPGMANWMHLFNGRTTIQQTFDAEVQANAIASSLKRHK